MEINPELSVNQFYDSNIYRLSNNEQSSWVTEISPRLETVYQQSYFKSLWALDFVRGIYSKNDEDNYTDQLFSGDLRWRINQRNEFAITGRYDKLHEDRGTGLTQGDAFSVAKPLTYHLAELSSRYQLGTEQSVGRLAFEIGSQRKTYDQDNLVTEGEDIQQSTATTEFDWRFGGSTALSLELEANDFDYLDDPLAVEGVADTKDSQSAIFLTGISWLVSGKTEGNLLLGYRHRNFEDSDREDFSGPSWKVDVNWKDKLYSEYRVSTARTERETNGDGSFIDAKQADAEWRAQWSSRFGTRLAFNYSEDTYVDSGTDRVDERRTARFDINYRMRYWLRWTLGVSYNENESSVQAFDYRRYTAILAADMNW